MKRSIQNFSPFIQLSTDTTLKSADSSGNKNYKNILWTTDISQELPVFLGKDEISSMKPTTVMEVFEEAVNSEKDNPALFIERDNKWISYTWLQFHKNVINFAKAAISIGVDPYQTVNILGNNSPEWFFAFLGGIYSCVIPVGIYLTNNTETCMYIAQHSNCGILCVDSVEQFKKYEKNLSDLKKLKAVVIWEQLDSNTLKGFINQYVPVYSFEDFISIGDRATVDIEFYNRIDKQKPGNCSNVVYTSGTTGNPKAVLLSHDNITYTCKAGKTLFNDKLPDRLRIVSYLPLSHIAGQIFDIMSKYIY